MDATWCFVAAGICAAVGFLIGHRRGREYGFARGVAYRGHVPPRPMPPSTAPQENAIALERKDVRFKVAPELHQALTVLAEIAQVDIGEFVEQIVRLEVIKQVHVASVIAERTSRLGITGKTVGTAGKGFPSQ